MLSALIIDTIKQGMIYNRIYYFIFEMHFSENGSSLGISSFRVFVGFNRVTFTVSKL